MQVRGFGRGEGMLLVGGSSKGSNGYEALRTLVGL